MKKKTTPQNVEEANRGLFTSKMNLPEAAEHCGMTQKEMKMTFREFLKYNKPDCKDFYGLVDNLNYESKSMDGIFCKKKPWTKEITLKNFRSKNLGLPEKTFDYMLLWDTKTYSVGICSWESCMKNTNIKDAIITFKVHFKDITFIASNVNPVEKEDFSEKLRNLIEQIV